MAASDCQVCCNTFNKVTRKPVSCFKCSYKACAACWKTYILGSINDAQCMNCHEMWSPEFMDDTFSKYWRTKDYKERRMQVLLDRERSQFPATIGAVEEEKQRRIIEKQLEELQRRIVELRNEETRLHQSLGRVPRGGNNNTSTNQPKILCKCPAATCNGFVLSASGTCAACDTHVCKDCFAIIPVPIKETEGEAGPSKSLPTDESRSHVCNPNDLATANLIKKECKPCPGCAVPIHRWTGCTMMWCTNCKTAFDWRTLEKITHGNVHNPHYIEYLARHRTQAAAAPAAGVAQTCNVVPNFYDLNSHLNRGVRNPQTRQVDPYMTTRQREMIMQQYRVIIHMRDVEMYRYAPDQLPADNSDLRVQLMMNDITEDLFKKMIIEREQKREKMRATYEILQMYTRVGLDLIIRIMQTPSKEKDTIMGISREIRTLNHYMIECFEKQTKRFGSLRKPSMDIVTSIDERFADVR